MCAKSNGPGHAMPYRPNVFATRDSIGINQPPSAFLWCRAGTRRERPGDRNDSRLLLEILTLGNLPRVGQCLHVVQVGLCLYTVGGYSLISRLTELGFHHVREDMP